MTKITFVEWPDGLKAEGEPWEAIKQLVSATKADILVTNEMPFGGWRPVGAEYDLDEAREWVAEHDRYLDAIKSLDVPAIISSRPIIFGDRLVNEAFAIENDNFQTLHHKHYFPSEDGWHEASWFDTDLQGFDVKQVSGINVGALLCTEAMFTEKARHYGREGADLIVVPRASGVNVTTWHAACSMAAVVSGAYVISSNRAGSSAGNIPQFGGQGLAYAPGGELLCNTSSDNPMKVIEMDINISKNAKKDYPCYLRY